MKRALVVNYLRCYVSNFIFYYEFALEFSLYWILPSSSALLSPITLLFQMCNFQRATDEAERCKWFIASTSSQHQRPANQQPDYFILNNEKTKILGKQNKTQKYKEAKSSFLIPVPPLSLSLRKATRKTKQTKRRHTDRKNQK